MRVKPNECWSVFFPILSVKHWQMCHAATDGTVSGICASCVHICLGDEPRLPFSHSVHVMGPAEV